MVFMWELRSKQIIHLFRKITPISWAALVWWRLRKSSLVVLSCWKNEFCIQFSSTGARTTDDAADIDGGCGGDDMKKMMNLCICVSE